MTDTLIGSYLVPLVFLVVGVLLMIFGIRSIVKVRRRRQHWLRYPGEAFDYVWESGNDSSIQFWMLRWIDNHGVQRTARNPYGVSGGTLKSFPFPVEVLVNPADPRDGQVSRGAHSGLTGAVVAIAAGLLFGLVGGLWLFVGVIAG
ncbi:MAG TPA: DUF3592 domain-containing protein [Microlunatus sp.]